MAPGLLVLSRQITQSQTPVAIILVIGETDNSPGYRIDTNVFFFFAGDGLQGNALPTGRSSRESGLVQKTRRGVKPSSRGVNEPFPSSLSFAKGYPLLPVFIATKRLVHVFYESSREMSISFFFYDFLISHSLSLSGVGKDE